VAMKVNLTNKYFLYRLKVREYEIEKIESILKTSSEVYVDSDTGRNIKVGKHDTVLVIVAYDIEQDGSTTPVTVYQTSRKQINYYLKKGRFHVKA
jgi:hypothetical protein